MAECPKCHQHLRLIDFKQTCKKCGANIFVYDLQERLMQDADKAEVQNYYFQRKLDRLKASYAGSKLAVARIFTSLLPIGAVFLPLAKTTAVEELSKFGGKVSLLTFINNSDALSDAANVLFSSEKGILPAVAFVFLAISLVATLLHLILLFLSCSPKGKPRNISLAGICVASSVIAPILFMCTGADAPIYGNIGIGSILFIALQILNLVIDLITFKKGIEIKHKPAFVGGIPFEEYQQMLDEGISHEEIRKEQYKRLQLIQDEKVRKLEEAEQKEQEAKKRGNK